jgi:hypothetical protein
MWLLGATGGLTARGRSHDRKASFQGMQARTMGGQAAHGTEQQL